MGSRLSWHIFVVPYWLRYEMNGSYGMESVGSAMPTGRDDGLKRFFKLASI